LFLLFPFFFPFLFLHRPKKINVEEYTMSSASTCIVLNTPWYSDCHLWPGLPTPDANRKKLQSHSHELSASPPSQWKGAYSLQGLSASLLNKDVGLKNGVKYPALPGVRGKAQSWLSIQSTELIKSVCRRNSSIFAASAK
jgi:hypothetical protein